MNDRILFFPVIIPFIAGILILLLPKRLAKVKELSALAGALIGFVLAISLFGRDLRLSLPWVSLGMEFSLRLYNFSSFILLAVTGSSFLVALYSLVFVHDKKYLSAFYAYFLITISFACGVVLADNLLLMLFFWEGLLVTMFGLISIGDKDAFKTATKAFVIIGITDLCLMAGIGLAGHLAGTLNISRMSLSLSGLGGLAFILLLTGAISKAGCMPFHSWVPDAAIDAPLPFMAFIPAALEKLLGIYLLTRICLDIFKLDPHSWASILLMVIGSVTIILAVMMALIQKDYKKLLSYHAISQVGYMILGIGTALPVGIVGGLFHMINNALYKSCLFFTGGAVEKQAGTTDLRELGGLGSRMPVTFICFLITALSISGVPPFNGFFSKELIYDGALERGLVFYLAAVLGSFFTAASFLKLGHSVFLGKISQAHKDTKEAPLFMLIPMIAIAFCCILFGVYNYLPLNKFIQPVLGDARLEGHDFSGVPTNIKLVIITLVVLIGAFLNHLYGFKSKGSAVKSVDHIHYAPVLSGIYDKAEKGFFDPYLAGLKLVGFISKLSWRFDRMIDWVYDNLTVKLVSILSLRIRALHNGNYSTYLIWSLAGMFIAVAFLISAL